MHRLSVSLLSILSLALLAAPGQAQTKLRYQFKPGEKRSYVVEQKMATKVNVKGMDIESKQALSMEMEYLVKKVDAKGNAQMELKFGRVKLSIESIAGIFEFDSADEKEQKNKVGKLLQPLVKVMASARMTLTKDPLGQVSEATIPEDVLKKLRALGGEGAAVGFDENTFKAMSDGGVVLPAEPVSKGKTWSHSLKADLPFGKITSDTQYTYEGQEEKDGKKLETFDLKPKIKIEPAGKDGLKITIKETEAKGKAWFDNMAGIVVEQTLELTMVMDVEVMGMNLTQHLVQNTIVRLKK